MSYLLPQFQLKTLLSSGFHTQRNKEHSYVRTQCVLSTTSTETSSSATSTIILDMEKLRLSSLETQSDLFAANRQWSYIGTIGPPMEANYEATVAAESLLTSDEAVIAAAAEEALTLAKAALRSAKDAALILKSISSSKADTTANTSLKTAEARMLQIVESEDGLQDESDDLEPSIEELQYLEEQFLNSVKVKSKRQKERKAKRARAAEKSAATVVSVKSGFTGRKKRASSQDVDYSDPLWYLRGTTSSTKLLTASEELQVSAGIQDLLKLEKLHEELKERCGGEPTFSQWAAAAEVDQRTLRRRLSHGTLCKDKMIKSNIRLVISIAKNYQGAGMNLQDLVQEGCRGLVRGAEKFDASKGFKFSTYGHWWIKQAVRKSLSDQSRTIRLPFHMVEATYRVKEARKQLHSETGKYPNMEEIAEATGLSLRRLNAVMMTPKAPRSLDQKIGPNLDLKPSEVIADPNAETLDEILIKQMMRQDLAKVLDTLNPREKEVVRWRYGLEGGRMKTLQEIGEMMGVSRERIRQIETFAFRKLKNKSRMQQLEQYSIAVS